MHIFPFHDSALLTLVNKIFTSFSQVFFLYLFYLYSVANLKKTAKDFKSDVWC